MNKVLLVDDEETILNVLSKILRKKGMEVVTTTDPKQAQSLMSNDRFHVVITDVRFNGLGSREGLELLAYIKRAYPDTKVIVMSGSGVPEYETEAYQNGASCFFDKPIDLNELTKYMENLIGNN